ncbi:MAG TPA: histidine kinase, partial [Burkholderiaceae bacterium]
MKPQVHQQSSWRHIAGAWLGIALFDASQTVFVMRAVGMHHAWATLFFVRMVSWLVWALATPCVYALMRRFPLSARRVLPWLIHAMACIAIGALAATWIALLESTLDPWLAPHGPPAFAQVWKNNFLGSLLGDLILYSGILALRAILDARERLARQEADSARLNAMLAQAQLAALRLQLEPHFMFNSLNAITGLVREGRNDEAVTMIASMSDLLRRVTNRSERQLVALEEEAAFLGKYLDIQGMRFADRLRCRLDIPEELKAARV